VGELGGGCRIVSIATGWAENGAMRRHLPHSKEGQYAALETVLPALLNPSRCQQIVLFSQNVNRSDMHYLVVPDVKSTLLSGYPVLLIPRKRIMNPVL
jgi:hypothetical protein